MRIFLIIPIILFISNLNADIIKNKILPKPSIVLNKNIKPISSKKIKKENFTFNYLKKLKKEKNFNYLRKKNIEIKKIQLKIIELNQRIDKLSIMTNLLINEIKEEGNQVTIVDNIKNKKISLKDLMKLKTKPKQDKIIDKILTNIKKQPKLSIPNFKLKPKKIKLNIFKPKKNQKRKTILIKKKEKKTLNLNSCKKFIPKKYTFVHLNNPKNQKKTILLLNKPLCMKKKGLYYKIIDNIYIKKENIKKNMVKLLNFKNCFSINKKAIIFNNIKLNLKKINKNKYKILNDMYIYYKNIKKD